MSKNRPVCFGRGESQDLDVSKMQRAQGLLDFGATDEESPSGAFFDFVECFGLTLLSMGSIAVEPRQMTSSWANDRTTRPISRGVEAT